MFESRISIGFQIVFVASILKFWLGRASNTKFIKFSKYPNSYYEQSTQTPVSPKHSNCFTCPTISDLENIECASSKSLPKYHAAYKSSFYPIYPPFNPGPSEQTHGLRDVVMAAAEMRKSVMISNFTTHKNDHLSSDKIVPFGARIDIDKMCEFVSLTSPDSVDTDRAEEDLYDDYMSYGNYTLPGKHLVSGDQTSSTSIGAVITITNRWKHTWEERLKSDEQKSITHYLDKFSNLKLHEKVKNVSLKASSHSNFPNEDSQNYQKLLLNSELAYNEPAIIAVAHPHNWIFRDTYSLIDSGGVYRFRNPVNGHSLPPNISEQDAAEKFRVNKKLLKQVYKYTPHPKFIRCLVDQFLDEFDIKSRNYVFVHWRFNEYDFLPGNFREFDVESRLKSNSKGIGDVYLEHIQATLRDPNYFLDLLLPHVRENFKNKPIPKTVYISAPYNTAKIFGEIKEFKGVKIVSTAGAFDFLEKFRDCEIIDRLFGDILSTFDKEIGVQSLSFYRSRPSNWSFNIQGQRFSKYSNEDLEHDRVVFDVFSGRQEK